MKKGIHPEVHQVIARCACGNAIKTSSTAPEVSMSICSNCHPFFTGATKFIDTAGRIEKFAKKYAKNAK
jgi:large subunit ribosomal protein L31